MLIIKIVRGHGAPAVSIINVIVGSMALFFFNFSYKEKLMVYKFINLSTTSVVIAKGALRIVVRFLAEKIQETKFTKLILDIEFFVFLNCYTLAIIYSDLKSKYFLNKPTFLAVYGYPMMNCDHETFITYFNYLINIF